MMENGLLDESKGKIEGHNQIRSNIQCSVRMQYKERRTQSDICKWCQSDCTAVVIASIKAPYLQPKDQSRKMNIATPNYISTSIVAVLNHTAFIIVKASNVSGYYLHSNEIVVTYITRQTNPMLHRQREGVERWRIKKGKEDQARGEGWRERERLTDLRMRAGI